MDRMISGLKLDSEEIYKRLCDITMVNSVISTYRDPKVGDVQVDPLVGTVSFGSVYHCWAFSLKRVAKAFADCDNDKERTRLTMQRFLPVSESILDMVVNHLPSPKEAQGYWAELLYTGDADDRDAQSIQSCVR